MSMTLYRFDPGNSPMVDFHQNHVCTQKLIKLEYLELTHNQQIQNGCKKRRVNVNKN